MSGLNSLGGLNNVNVDFRPTVELNAPKKDGKAPQQPVANVAPEIKSKAEITNSDGKKVEVNKTMGEDEKKKSNFVTKYFTTSCPSYYKRDYLHRMFK